MSVNISVREEVVNSEIIRWSMQSIVISVSDGMVERNCLKQIFSRICSKQTDLEVVSDFQTGNTFAYLSDCYAHLP